MNENLVFIVGLVFHNLDLVHGGWQSLYHAKSIPKLINKFPICPNFVRSSYERYKAHLFNDP